MNRTTSTGQGPSQLTVRIAAAVVMIVVAMLAIVAGGLLFWTLAAIVGLLMMAEWCDLDRASADAKRVCQLTMVVPLAIMSPLAAGPYFLALGTLFGAFFFVGAVFRRPMLAIGVLYVGLPILALVLLEHQPHAVTLTLWTLSLVWATDIGAFFAGRAIGGPKLAPRLSPNKTWAGLIGGVLAATLLALAFHAAAGLAMVLTLATPALAVLAQLGDLYESALKRRAGVKDSGTILPGHGGVLDRLDGLVPVAPAAALLAVLLPRLYTLL